MVDLAVAARELPAVLLRAMRNIMSELCTVEWKTRRTILRKMHSARDALDQHLQQWDRLDFRREHAIHSGARASVLSHWKQAATNFLHWLSFPQYIAMEADAQSDVLPAGIRPGFGKFHVRLQWVIQPTRAPLRQYVAVDSFSQPVAAVTCGQLAPQEMRGRGEPTSRILLPPVRLGHGTIICARRLAWIGRRSVVQEQVESDKVPHFHNSGRFFYNRSVCHMGGT